MRENRTAEDDMAHGHVARDFHSDGAPPFASLLTLRRT
jgi:hypothetical protein